MMLVFSSSCTNLRDDSSSLENSVIENEGAMKVKRDVGNWRRSSSECLRKWLPNASAYTFTRRASLPSRTSDDRNFQTSAGVYKGRIIGVIFNCKVLCGCLKLLW